MMTNEDRFIHTGTQINKNFQVVYASQNAGCHSFSCQKTLTTDYPKFCAGMPVVRRDGRAVGVRSRHYQIFSDG